MSGAWRQGSRTKRTACAACGTSGGRNDGRACVCVDNDQQTAGGRTTRQDAARRSRQDVRVRLGVALSEGRSSLLE